MLDASREVDHALDERIHRVNLLEEKLREFINEGMNLKFAQPLLSVAATYMPARTVQDRRDGNACGPDQWFKRDQPGRSCVRSPLPHYSHNFGRPRGHTGKTFFFVSLYP